MPEKFFITIAICFMSVGSFAQEGNIQAFGNLLADAITKNDSVAFKSLILPKKAMIADFKEHYASDLDKETVEYTLNAIENDYDDMTISSYMFTLFNLTTKTEIFNLNLQDLEYNIVELEELSKYQNVTAIHAKIDHDTYAHFTFYIYNFKDQLFLANHLISISEVNKFEERASMKKVTMSSDDEGYLISQGTIVLDDATAPRKQILDCILDAPITIGVEDSSRESDKTSDFEYILGAWTYTYYLNDMNDYAGMVSFDYIFKIYDGRIAYEYSNFFHSQDDSEFKSIGQLTYKPGELAFEVFTEEQYAEILKDVYINQVLAIKHTRNYTNKCVK